MQPYGYYRRLSFCCQMATLNNSLSIIDQETVFLECQKEINVTLHAFGSNLHLAHSTSRSVINMLRQMRSVIVFHISLRVCIFSSSLRRNSKLQLVTFFFKINRYISKFSRSSPCSTSNLQWNFISQLKRSTNFLNKCTKVNQTCFSSPILEKVPLIQNRGIHA